MNCGFINRPKDLSIKIGRLRGPHLEIQFLNKSSRMPAGFNQPTSDIESVVGIQFGIFSPDEIIRRSVGKSRARLPMMATTLRLVACLTHVWEFWKMARHAVLADKPIMDVPVTLGIIV